MPSSPDKSSEGESLSLASQYGRPQLFVTECHAHPELDIVARCQSNICQPPAAAVVTEMLQVLLGTAYNSAADAAALQAFRRASHPAASYCDDELDVDFDSFFNNTR